MESYLWVNLEGIKDCLCVEEILGLDSSFKVLQMLAKLYYYFYIYFNLRKYVTYYFISVANDA